jgi:hypothetical protein
LEIPANLQAIPPVIIPGWVPGILKTICVTGENRLWLFWMAELFRSEMLLSIPTESGKERIKIS